MPKKKIKQTIKKMVAKPRPKPSKPREVAELLPTIAKRRSDGQTSKEEEDHIREQSHSPKSRRSENAGTAKGQSHSCSRTFLVAICSEKLVRLGRTHAR